MRDDRSIRQATFEEGGYVGEEVVDRSEAPLAVWEHAAESVVLEVFDRASEGDGMLAEDVGGVVVKLVGVVVERVGADRA